MGSVCAEQQQQHHMFHPSHQLYLNKKSPREIDIPPRKLLGRSVRSSPEMFTDSPKGEDAAFSKFLPYNNLEDEDDYSDPYSSDHFKMYEFKVRKCNRSRSHDWTDCPFAHPAEKARRRDPRRYHYSGSVCSEFRKGNCGKGDNCEYAHGVFECWLHPSRYRTEACKDGKSCRRKVCFFAHSTRQLRILPEISPSPPLDQSPTAAAAAAAERSYRSSNCCVYCHSASPKSTLMATPMSPPISPMCSPEFSPYGNRFNAAGMRYKEALNLLMASFDAMNVNHDDSISSPWVDVRFGTETQSKFALSPPNLNRSHLFPGDFSDEDDGGRYDAVEKNSSNSSVPDLGWVNDLLT